MPPLIILFTYDISVFGRKTDWVLNLKGLKYFRCIVLNRLPRPVLQQLGVQYRRIPILAIGRDIYCDTRLIIDKLEELFPENRISSTSPFEKGLEHLFENWLIDGGPFWRTAGLIPPTAEVMHDKEWLQDRTNMTGRKFDIETLKQGRAESLSHVRMYFNQMEHELLADGRQYLLATKEPTLADVHAIWTFDWALQEKGHMFEYLEKEVIGEDQFPRTFAYVNRFRRSMAKKEEQNGIPEALSSTDAVKRILASDFFEKEGTIDPRDPLKLRKGQLVEIWPVESGFTHHDKGELVSIGVKEVVISSRPNVGEGRLRLHFPRVNFRIKPVEESKL
ncbi:glutathione S-transferase [Cladophialophora carrionii]|uniref:Glutathione S-transferase n=1 Tax=Cladophialophora carrionii TaxID=86049 RepID=A0A1C1CBA1_9EURO|nr:glutathione S-transferase [Cladophialophora carrionii]